MSEAHLTIGTLVAVTLVVLVAFWFVSRRMRQATAALHVFAALDKAELTYEPAVRVGYALHEDPWFKSSSNRRTALAFLRKARAMNLDGYTRGPALAAAIHALESYDDEPRRAMEAGAAVTTT